MKTIKRYLSVAFLALFAFTGCSLEGEDNNANTDTKTETSDTAQAPKTEGNLKIGVSLSTLNNPFFVSIREGIEEGAELIRGEVPEKSGKGYYVKPAIFTNVKPGMIIHDEEIFGPVLSIVKVKDVDEAIAYFEQAVSIDEQHLLSQHALKMFKTMKEEE